MSRRNSLKIEAEKVTIVPGTNANTLTIAISAPSADDLVCLIAEASKLLEHRRRRGELNK